MRDIIIFIAIEQFSLSYIVLHWGEPLLLQSGTYMSGVAVYPVHHLTHYMKTLRSSSPPACMLCTPSREKFATTRHVRLIPPGERASWQRRLRTVANQPPLFISVLCIFVPCVTCWIRLMRNVQYCRSSDINRVICLTVAVVAAAHPAAVHD